eukprot:s3883_g3.t1
MRFCERCLSPCFTSVSRMCPNLPQIQARGVHVLPLRDLTSTDSLTVLRTSRQVNALAQCGRLGVTSRLAEEGLGMDDYREAQRAKWLRAQSQSHSTQEDSAHVGASSQGSVAAEPRPEAAQAAQVHSGATAAVSAEAPVLGRASPGSSLSKQNARRVHILPVFPSSCDQSQRLEILSPLLRSMRNSQTPVKTGLFLRPAGYEFVVVKCEPDDAILAMNTDYFIEGSPLKRFEKVQFICLWDFERTRTDQDATALFQEYINPYFKRLNSNEVTSIVSVNEQLQINGMEFQVMAAEPVPPEIGIVDLSTVVFVDWDNTPEFSKIHFVPFQDTLPAAYEYDIFNDYLKPYLTRNKQQSFAMNDQFTFQGVQFKVVCCEPRGERGRIGKNTTIYCEGVLHPSLRNLLPPEMSVLNTWKKPNEACRQIGRFISNTLAGRHRGASGGTVVPLDVTCCRNDRVTSWCARLWTGGLQGVSLATLDEMNKLMRDRAADPVPTVISQLTRVVEALAQDKFQRTRQGPDYSGFTQLVLGEGRPP